MKTLVLRLFAIAAALCLSSCFQYESVIHVKKDGSGTLVEQTVFGQQVKDMLAQMAAMGGENGAGKDPIAEMFSEEKAKAKLASMGEGVSFEKVEKVTVNGNDGYRVTYKFSDINKLRLDPGDATQSMKPPGMPEPEKKSEPVTFTFADGKLKIHMPKPEFDKKEETAAAEIPEITEDDTANPQMEAMKKMFSDMKMSIRVVAEDGIAETDATHVSENSVILMEMDFGKLVENPTAFKKLQSAKPETPEEMEKLFKGVDGVKVETKELITVTFK